MVENYINIDKVIIPKFEDVLNLAFFILKISDNETKKLRFENCYRLFYIFCIHNKNKNHNISTFYEKIKFHMISNLLIVNEKNLKILRDIMGYFINKSNSLRDKYIVNELEFMLKDTNNIVLKRRNHIKNVLKKFISNDIYIIVSRYI